MWCFYETRCFTGRDQEEQLYLMSHTTYKHRTQTWEKHQTWNARWEGPTLSKDGHAHFRYGTPSMLVRPIIHGGRSLIAYSTIALDGNGSCSGFSTLVGIIPTSDKKNVLQFEELSLLGSIHLLQFYLCSTSLCSTSLWNSSSFSGVHGVVSLLDENDGCIK